MLAVRALLAFLALPGVVAGVVPVVLARGDAARGAGTAIGWPVLAAGVVVLGWCVRDFFVAGGTLAPWDPPRRLVVVGLYRVVRNPMYVGVLGVLAGEALLLGSPTLGVYTAVVAVAFHLRVVLGEEPWLARTFGDAWTRYAATVPRWLPRRRPVAGGPR